MVDRKWEESVGYDPSVNYYEEVMRYNRLAAMGDTVATARLLERYGGLLNLLRLDYYQRGGNPEEVK
jgi:hypothetical protein